MDRKSGRDWGRSSTVTAVVVTGFWMSSEEDHWQVDGVGQR